MDIPYDPAVIVRTTAKPAGTPTSLPAGQYRAITTRYWPLADHYRAFRPCNSLGSAITNPCDCILPMRMNLIQNEYGNLCISCFTFKTIYWSF